ISSSGNIQLPDGSGNWEHISSSGPPVNGAAPGSRKGPPPLPKTARAGLEPQEAAAVTGADGTAKTDGAATLDADLDVLPPPRRRRGAPLRCPPANPRTSPTCPRICDAHLSFRDRPDLLVVRRARPRPRGRARGGPATHARPAQRPSQAALHGRKQALRGREV